MRNRGKRETAHDACAIASACRTGVSARHVSFSLETELGGGGCRAEGVFYFVMEIRDFKSRFKPYLVAWRTGHPYQTLVLPSICSYHFAFGRARYRIPILIENEDLTHKTTQRLQTPAHGGRYESTTFSDRAIQKW